MSHKDSKPKTREQMEMEEFHNVLLAKQGTVCGWGLDKHSEYLAPYARNAWLAWQAAYQLGLAASALSHTLKFDPPPLQTSKG